MSTTTSKFITKGNKVHFISLGCPRNLVDSEVMLGILLKAGYEVTENHKEADYLILNTCAFIEEARTEATDYLEQLVKERKINSKIVLTGCMVSKHKELLSPWMDHIHYFLGSGDIENILKAIEDHDKGEQISSKSYLEMGEVPRKLSTPKHYAYLKIAEGCRKKCAFCIIPDIKGPLKSKPLSQVIHEFRLLIKSGIKEVILIAQDLGDYGKDISKDKTSLLETLLKNLLNEKGDFWIRMLYLYPDEVTDGIIDLMKQDDRLLPYVDIPIQHIDDALLKKMKRKTTSEQIQYILTKLKQSIPHIYIRSSLIVGFPGETEEQFLELLNFVKEGFINNLGVFTYSNEIGSASYNFNQQVNEQTKQKRLEVLTQAQQNIAFEKNISLIGKEVIGVLDGYHEDSNLLFKARFYGQAPDIDGCIIINNTLTEVEFGERFIIQITNSLGYDLIGTIKRRV